MNTLKYKERYQRRLPHIQPPGATFFITFRLADSIPRDVWKNLRSRLDALDQELAETAEDDQALTLERERLWFREYEEYLHNTCEGPVWLNDERIAGLVAKQCHHFDDERYRLDAFCVMPNHVHIVLKPLPDTEAGRVAYLNHKLVEDRDRKLGYLTEACQFVPVTFYSLASIMHSIKRHTATEANRLLGRSGTFWQAESYDRYIRKEDEWSRTVSYVLNNPVKAGLVKEWQEWRWNWRRENV